MILSRQEFLQKKAKYLRMIKEGAIFVYPSDTVYGVGCDATNNQAVLKVRQLKNRNIMPLSVMAPNKKWIEDNCEADQEWLARLPGPYTLNMKLKQEHAVAPGVTMGRDTIGVRVPSHWIADIVEELGIPIVATSANLTGQNVMHRLEDLPEKLLHVDFIIYEGEKRGQQATLIDLTGKPKKQ